MTLGAKTWGLWLASQKIFIFVPRGTRWPVARHQVCGQWAQSTIVAAGLGLGGVCAEGLTAQAAGYCGAGEKWGLYCRPGWVGKMCWFSCIECIEC